MRTSLWPRYVMLLSVSLTGCDNPADPLESLRHAEVIDGFVSDQQLLDPDVQIRASLLDGRGSVFWVQFGERVSCFDAPSMDCRTGSARQ